MKMELFWGIREDGGFYSRRRLGVRFEKGVVRVGRILLKTEGSRILGRIKYG